uniref:Uncharacterized protein n=1 Tax=Oryza glumipatula TaxID=40148 RepID=A0A0D9YD57_9ORYZ
MMPDPRQRARARAPPIPSPSATRNSTPEISSPSAGWATPRRQIREGGGELEQAERREEGRWWEAGSKI